MNKNQKNPIILIVDEKTSVLETLQSELQGEGYFVKTLCDGHRIIDMIGELVPDLVLLDIFMPNCNGLEFLSRIKKEYPEQEVIITSDFGDISVAIQALKKGALDFIKKPLNLEKILPKLAFLHQETISAQPEKSSSDQDCNLIGASVTFQEQIRQLKLLAPLAYPLLLYGKHGTGKSILAQFVHAKGSHSDKQFITIECSILLPEQQKEQLLNSFMNKQATVYVKHVEDLTSENQKILALLLEKKEATVRLIASTCVSLFALVQKKMFNQKLFRLLNVIPLEIASLHKHAYDIPLLVDHFLHNANNELSKTVVLSRSVIRKLRNYSWPNNIAELKNVVYKIVALCDEKHHVVTVEDLHTIWGEKQAAILDEQIFFSFSSLDGATKIFQKNFLEYVLKKNYYNLEQVSSRLSMNVIELRNKLHELNIEQSG